MTAAWHYALDGKDHAARRRSLATAQSAYRARFAAALPAPLRVTRCHPAVIVVYPLPEVVAAQTQPATQRATNRATSEARESFTGLPFGEVGL